MHLLLEYLSGLLQAATEVFESTAYTRRQASTSPVVVCRVISACPGVPGALAGPIQPQLLQQLLIQQPTFSL